MDLLWGRKYAKILKNRELYRSELHNYALSYSFYVPKYIREGLCCIPSNGFELKALNLIKNHDLP